MIACLDEGQVAWVILVLCFELCFSSRLAVRSSVGFDAVCSHLKLGATIAADVGSIQRQHLRV